MITGDGVVTTFLSEKTPLTDRKDTGKQLVSIDKKDPVVDVVFWPEVDSEAVE
ncbi:hypothetical protein D3C78_1981330 [compost metagenome]